MPVVRDSDDAVLLGAADVDALKVENVILKHENAQLKVTLHHLVREAMDMTAALRNTSRSYNAYTPALRKARKLLGLKYQGPIDPDEVDPTIL